MPGAVVLAWEAPSLGVERIYRCVGTRMAPGAEEGRGKSEQRVFFKELISNLLTVLIFLHMDISHWNGSLICRRK